MKPGFLNRSNIISEPPNFKTAKILWSPFGIMNRFLIID